MIERPQQEDPIREESQGKKMPITDRVVIADILWWIALLVSLTALLGIHTCINAAH